MNFIDKFNKRINNPIIRCAECGGSQHPLSSNWCSCKEPVDTMDWREYFIGIANAVKLKSKDPSTKIGAVIVGDDNEIVSTGYNSFPRGLDDSVPERFKRPEKYSWFEHAERNAIYNAARIGVSVKGCTIVLTCGLPCIDCGRGIINSGIRKIICKQGENKSHGLKGKHWEENIAKSEVMLKEAGIEIEYY